MMRFTATALLALFRHHITEFRRYAFNAVASLTVAYLFFLLVFLGSRFAIGDGPNYDATLAEIVVGLMVWLLALQAFTDVAARIGNEAAQGTLEQLALSPLGLRNVLLLRALVRFVLQLAYTLVFLGLMMATTGRRLSLNLPTLVPILFLTTLGVQGLGFALAGLTLLVKRAQALFGLFQFMFIGLLALPTTKTPLLALLPLSLGGSLATRVMVEDRTILDLHAVDLGLLGLNGVVYLWLGLFLFGRCDRMARDRGTLGHY